MNVSVCSRWFDTISSTILYYNQGLGVYRVSYLMIINAYRGATSAPVIVGQLWPAEAAAAASTAVVAAWPTAEEMVTVRDGHDDSAEAIVPAGRRTRVRFPFGFPTISVAAGATGFWSGISSAYWQHGAKTITIISSK